jgi:hypothetical protein
MKNKSSSPEFRDVKPKMKLEPPFDLQGFLISVTVNDAMENLESEPVRYLRVRTKCASTLHELALGHA